MISLTPQKISEIHDLIIHYYGGASGILCQGTVDYLIDQINAEPDFFRKATLALHIIATCHPFMDGNKRTAFQIADLILGSEGWFIHGEKDRIIRALLKIARYECDVGRGNRKVAERKHRTSLTLKSFTSWPGTSLARRSHACYFRDACVALE